MWNNVHSEFRNSEVSDNRGWLAGCGGGGALPGISATESKQELSPDASSGANASGANAASGAKLALVSSLAPAATSHWRFLHVGRKSVAEKTGQLEPNLRRCEWRSGFSGRASRRVIKRQKQDKNLLPARPVTHRLPLDNNPPPPSHWSTRLFRPSHWLPRLSILCKCPYSGNKDESS